VSNTLFSESESVERFKRARIAKINRMQEQERQALAEQQQERQEQIRQASFVQAQEKRAQLAPFPEETTPITTPCASFEAVLSDQRAERFEQLQAMRRRRKFDNEVRSHIKQASAKNPAPNKRSLHQIESELQRVNEQLYQTQLEMQVAMEQPEEEEQKPQETNDDDVHSELNQYNASLELGGGSKPEQSSSYYIRAFSLGPYNEQDRSYQYLTHYTLELSQHPQLAIQNEGLKQGGVQDGQILVVSARRRTPDSSNNKRVVQFNANGLSKWSNDSSQKIILPTKLTTKKEVANVSEKHVMQLSKELPLILEHGAVVRDMVKFAGLDTTLIHPAKEASNNAVVNARKMSEGAREIQTFVPHECHRPSCSICYSTAAYGTIKDWSAAESRI